MITKVYDNGWLEAFDEGLDTARPVIRLNGTKQPNQMELYEAQEKAWEAWRKHRKVVTELVPGSKIVAG